MFTKEEILKYREIRKSPDNFRVSIRLSNIEKEMLNNLKLDTGVGYSEAIKRAIFKCYGL
jgi:hypothetical protein